MAAVAGPSNPLKNRKLKNKTKNAVKSGKVKKITEKQRIAELEKAASDFVSITYFELTDSPDYFPGSSK